LIISLAGIFYPKLGYFLLVVFATLIIIALKRQMVLRQLVSEGSFVDFWLGPISRKVKIPDILRSMWFRVPVLVALMGSWSLG
jgi:ferredoxin-type protein NapH